MLAATRPDPLVLRPSRGGARFVSVKGRARIAARNAATRFASALYHNPGGYRLLKAARVLRHPLEFARRRSASRDSTPHELLKVDDAEGYRWIDPTLIGGFTELWATVQSHLTRVRPEIATWRQSKGEYHATTFDLVGDEDIDGLPALLEYATSDELLHAVFSYLGEVPVLRRVSVGYSSRLGEPVTGSMQYHLDGEDSRQLKLFILLDEVSAERGPLHFYSARDTERILRSLPRERPAGPEVRAFGPWRDEDVERAAGHAPMVFTGGPGKGLLIDTSRCIHYGARVSDGHERFVFMLAYRSLHSVHDTPFNVLRPDRFDDPVRRAVLQGTERLPLGWFFPHPSLGPEARGGGGSEPVPTD